MSTVGSWIAWFFEDPLRGSLFFVALFPVLGMGASKLGAWIGARHRQKAEKERMAFFSQAYQLTGYCPHCMNTGLRDGQPCPICKTKPEEPEEPLTQEEIDAAIQSILETRRDR